MSTVDVGERERECVCVFVGERTETNVRTFFNSNHPGSDTLGTKARGGEAANAFIKG